MIRSNLITHNPLYLIDFELVYIYISGSCFYYRLSFFLSWHHGYSNIVTRYSKWIRCWSNLWFTTFWFFTTYEWNIWARHVSDGHYGVILPLVLRIGLIVATWLIRRSHLRFLPAFKYLQVLGIMADIHFTVMCLGRLTFSLLGSVSYLNRSFARIGVCKRISVWITLRVSVCITSVIPSRSLYDW